MEIEEDEVKTFKDYIQIARRRKYYIVIPMLFLLALSSIIALILPPVYRSEATILIEQQHIPIELVKSTVVSFADERIQQIKQKIMRIDSINRMITKFNLYSDQAGKLSPTEFSETFAENVLVDVVSADVISQGRQSKATLAFTISFDHKNPVIAQKVANELVTLFLSENARSRTERAKETTKFLNEESKKYRKKIQIIENKIAEYKDNYSQSLPELLPVSMSSISRIEAELQQLRLQENMLKERQSNIRSQMAMTSTSSGQNQQDIVLSLPALKTKYSRLLNKYSKSHPDVKALNRKIENYDENNNDGANNLNGSGGNPIFLQLRSELSVAGVELKNIGQRRLNLNESLQKLEVNISQTHQVERGYNDLLRDLEGNKTKYNELKAKHMDAKLALTLEEEQKAEKFSILEPPRVPTKPEKPNRFKIIFLGLMISIFSGLGTGYLVESMDGSIRGQKALTKITGFEPLVVIPYIINDEDLVKTRKNVINFSFIVGGIILSMILAIHFLYMSLDLLWYKILHKIEMMMLF